jgi:hypothetical protein
VRQRQFLSLDAVIRHKQPTREALLDGAAAVGERRHRRLVEEVIDVTEQRAVKRSTLIDRLAQDAGFEPAALAWSLHVGLVLRTLVTQQNREAGHAFTADDAHFDRFFPAPFATTEAKPLSGK